MSKETTAELFTGVRPYRGRTAMYRWLRAHYHELAALLEKEEPSWAEVAARIAQHGVANRKGAVPSGHSVRRVWKTVCRDVAASGADAPPAQGPATRVPRDLRPAVAQAPIQPVQPRNFRDIPALSGGWPNVKPQPQGGEVNSAERLSGKEEIERVRQMLKDDF